MSKQDKLHIDQQQLADAWQHTLPEYVNEADRVSVLKDEADSRALRITLESAGHQMYSFDFKAAYVDSREVKVTLIDVERDGRSIDERTDMIQELVQDYTRHIHECAQALHVLTNA